MATIFDKLARLKFRNFRLINSARNCAAAGSDTAILKQKKKKIIERSFPKVAIKRKVLPINGTDGDSSPKRKELLSKENHKRSSPPRSERNSGPRDGVSSREEFRN